MEADIDEGGRLANKRRRKSQRRGADREVANEGAQGS